MLENRMEIFKKDIATYHNFLVEQGINVYTQAVSLEFLKVMFMFTDISGDRNYSEAICRFLKHESKYRGLTTAQEVS